MHWLAELLVELLSWLIPWKSHHANRSRVGESRLDHQARAIGIALFALAVLVVGGCLYLRS